MSTVLMTGKSIHPAAHDYLIQSGLDVVYLKDNQAAEIDHIIATRQVDAIIARTHAIPRSTIDNASALRIISRHGVGYDNVDLDAASARGIPVTIAPGTNAQAVAEMTLALMFAVARRVVPLARDTQSGGWDRSASGIELSGKTLGVIGFGRIGQRVAFMAHALGMQVLVFDPFGSPVAGVNYAASVDALVADADVVSLHCPAQPDGSALVTTELLAHFRQGSVLINTSRGSLIDEAALHRAIESGALFGAGLDTLSVEPPEHDHPLLQLDRVVVTPHMGGSTAQALEKTALRAAKNVVDFLRDGTVDGECLVNPNYVGG